MADNVNKERRSQIMGSIRSSNTKPELFVRKFLYSKGLRFRVNDNKLPGKPDIKIAKYKTLIFVNGCFWHGHKNCKIYVMPKSNIEFWRNKIETNVKRDKKNIRKLKKIGWRVEVIWECKLKGSKGYLFLESFVNKIINKPSLLITV